jgi:hypothetical protein
MFVVLRVSISLLIRRLTVCSNRTISREPKVNRNVDEMSEQSKEQCTDKETIETQIPQDFEYVVGDFEILTTCNLVQTCRYAENTNNTQ